VREAARHGVRAQGLDRDALREDRTLQLLDDHGADQADSGLPQVEHEAGDGLRPEPQVAAAVLRRAARVREERRSVPPEVRMNKNDDFGFSIDLTVRNEWRNIDLLRTSVQNCFIAVFADFDGCHSIAMVTGELLENALKYGDWTRGDRAMFRLRVQGR